MAQTQKNVVKAAGKKAPAGPPSCEGGTGGKDGKEVELSLNEVYTNSISCHECGTRHVITKTRTDGWRTYAYIPPHKVPAELHEYRLKLERESKRERQSVRI